MGTKKRQLTDAELLRWGENLNNDDWTGITAHQLLSVMRDTAGNKYDSGRADYAINLSDAARMLALMK